MDSFIFSQQLHMLLLYELSVNEYRVARRARGFELSRDSSDAILCWEVFFLLSNNFSKWDLETSLI
jgi:hypothetical protein